MPRNRILLIDDERNVRFGIRNFLQGRDYDVAEADSVKSGEELFRSDRPDLAIIDYSLPDGNALEMLPRLKETDPNVPIVILTGHGSIDLAVKAIKDGADQFLTKPVQLPALLVVIERLLENEKVRHREQARATKTASRREPDPFLGTSEAIRSLREQVGKVVDTDRTILIHGETGTGKSVLAAWLHRHGSRADEAFVDLNCAGLSKEFVETELFGHEKGAFTGAVNAKTGLLEVAHRGVLFLDEIGDVDVQVQPKLLKVLEEKRFRRLGDVRDRVVDIQLIAATHQDLNQLIRERKFRNDLYFRINTIPLTIPSLRERPEDIAPLAQYFLDVFANEIGRGEFDLSASARNQLMTYPWPGNIRELKNVLERAVLIADKKTLTPKDLRFDSAAPPAESEFFHLTLEEMEKRHIDFVLREEKGKVDTAAQRLGIPRSSLYQKIKKFGIIVSKP